MAITFTCSCGKPLRSKDDAAGRRTKCPHCGQVLTIPVPGEKAVAIASGATESPHMESLLFDLDLHTSDTPIASLSTPQAETETSGIKIDSAAQGSEEPTRPGNAPKVPGILQYKVLSQKDHSTSAKFNALRLEEVLNDHSKQGWSVKSAVVMTVKTHAGDIEEMIVILER